MIIIGDAKTELKKLQSGSIDCCVTSPPYYGLRDYGVDGQIGLEETHYQRSF
jgi:DNA modification methylase